MTEAMRILVVEDETVLAIDLADRLEGLGFLPVGPVCSVQRALSLVEEVKGIKAAVLDVNLRDEPIWPVADRLEALGVPFIFITGYGPRGIEARYADRPIIAKPFQDEQLSAALGKVLDARE